MKSTMKPYHKIKTVWQRDPATSFSTLIEGTYATPEFEYLADNQWIWTEKVDGTNIRVMWGETIIQFGGKSDNAQIPPHLEQRLTEMFAERRSRCPTMFEAPHLSLWRGLRTQDPERRRPVR